MIKMAAGFEQLEKEFNENKIGTQNLGDYLVDKMIKQEINLLLIKKRAEAKKRKLTANILIYHRAHWAMDSVYQELVKAGFEVTIIITPAMEIHEDLRQGESQANFEFFKNLGYNVIEGCDFNTGTLYDIKKNLPDLIFYQTHWMCDYPEEYNIKGLYNKTLCVSIPYGPYVANIQQEQFNQEFHRYVWLNCAENIVAQKMSEKYAKNCGSNVVVTGYPKIDKLYDSKTTFEGWKNFENKKIIWAPHYSINTGWEINYANFHIYYRNFYEFVKNNQNIDMVLKPHPILKSRCIQTGTLSEEGYENYVNSWQNLPNGAYYAGGNYMGVFKTSDAMILDSLGFIIEYLYTKKPICFINKFSSKEELKEHFNEFGQLAIEQCYIAQNWNDIEKFINDVIINGNDSMREKREDFYNKYLKINEGHVGRSIVEYVQKELGIK